MAAALVKGNALTSLQELDGSPVIERVGDIEQSRTYRYACLWSSQATLIAALPDACPDNAELTLQSTNVARESAAAIVTVVYALDAVSAGTQLPPGGASSDPVRDSDTNASERPIEQHPNFNYRNGDGVAVLNGNPKPGVEAYLDGQPSHSYTFWAAVAPASYTENLIKVNKQKTVNPAGIASPSSGKWLKLGRRIRTAGKTSTGDLLLEITEQYQYNDAAWDTDIYSAGNSALEGTA